MGMKVENHERAKNLKDQQALMFVWCRRDLMSHGYNTDVTAVTLMEIAISYPCSWSIE